MVALGRCRQTSNLKSNGSKPSGPASGYDGVSRLQSVYCCPNPLYEVWRTDQRAMCSENLPAHHTGSPTTTSSGVINMPKSKQSNKEAKKQAVLTPKEKKAVKQVKKHAGDIVPMIVKSA